MKRTLYILYILTGCLGLWSCGAEQAMKKGDKFMAVGEYYDAAEQYRKAYLHTPRKERTTRGELPATEPHQQSHHSTEQRGALQKG